MRKSSLLLIVLLLLVIPANAIKVSKVSCEYQEEALALTTFQPRFGWQLSAAEPNVLQSAYEIEVITTYTQTAVWQSGKVNSDASQHVTYSGLPLSPATAYSWRVRVWDAAGKVSAWSRTARFRTAPDLKQLGEQSWIGAIRSDSAGIPAGKRFYSREMRTPEYRAVWAGIDSLSRKSIQLRKSFVTTKKVVEAITHISGLGHYELTVNGVKVGDSEFAPLWSDYVKTVYYNSYDISALLKKGENVFGVLLGNGFYNVQGGRYTKLKVSFGAPTLWMVTELRYDDGSVELIRTDESWKYDLSPIVFNDTYGGEDYDARLEQKGWDKPGFTAANWKPVVLQDAPAGELTPQQSDPVKIMSRYQPVSRKLFIQQELDSASKKTKRRLDASAMVFDMGQNLSGFPEIKVRGRKGDEIIIFVSEALTPEGACDQRQTGRPHYYRYVLKGEGEESWRPRFSYYGFRYIQVEGAVQKGDPNPRKLPVLTGLQSCFVHNSVTKLSTFETSSDLFNKTHRLIEMAVKSNMQAVFTDCPHREKLGWLEQVHLNGPGLLYNYDLTRFGPKIMRDMADAQQPNGMVPTTAPLYNIFGTANGGFDEFGDSPEWGSTFIIFPHMYEEFYGDSTLLFDYYPHMRRYMEYLISRAEDHELSFGLGDWYDYGDFRAGYSRNTPVPYVATAYYYYDLKLMAALAVRVGNKLDAKLFGELATAVRERFNERWFDAATASYATGSQTALALAVYLDIVEPQYRKPVLDRLVQAIQEKGNRLTTGDVGNRYLFQVLATNGLNELMYDMHHHYEAPGYGFQLQFGATTLTEQWDPRMGSSWNHFMMGQIDEWFFASLAGIRPEQGYKHIIIEPRIVGELSHVKASTGTIYGEVSVHWKRSGKQVDLTVILPVNTRATVRLPGLSDQLVGSGTHSFTTTLPDSIN
ncbi:MAG: family 78 glycoside hydrolase catalytic domain [Paludibacter sp.]|nr:family 78 glycoside hydrolase catalytic domain [Paludibacter sp.]